MKKGAHSTCDKYHIYKKSPSLSYKHQEIANLLKLETKRQSNGDLK